MTTTTATATWIADIDFAGHAPMERPAMMFYVDAATEPDALAQARARVAASGDAVRGVRLLQPILDRVREDIAEGLDWSISWKSEGGAGPVALVDHALQGAEEDDGAGIGIPFGSDPPWLVLLPWSRVTEARRLAKYLGLKLVTS